jgi:phosphatidylglycerol:prolipoprotein diacylglycerol transferase
MKVGNITAFYLMYYSICRFFIERLRTDSLMIGGFKVAQIISVILFIIGLVIIIINTRKGKFENLYNDSYNKEIRF